MVFVRTSILLPVAILYPFFPMRPSTRTSDFLQAFLAEDKVLNSFGHREVSECGSCPSLVAVAEWATAWEERSCVLLDRDMSTRPGSVRIVAWTK